MTDTEKEGTLYMRGIPSKVKKKFKLWCVENNLSMTEVVVACMKGLVKGVGLELLDRKEERKS